MKSLYYETNEKRQVAVVVECLGRLWLPLSGVNESQGVRGEQGRQRDVSRATRPRDSTQPGCATPRRLAAATPAAAPRGGGKGQRRRARRARALRAPASRAARTASDAARIR